MNQESARLALLMYADANGQVKSPSISLDWKTVHQSALTVDFYCVRGRHSGGVWIINGMSQAVINYSHNSCLFRSFYLQETPPIAIGVDLMDIMLTSTTVGRYVFKSTYCSLCLSSWFSIRRHHQPIHDYRKRHQPLESRSIGYEGYCNECDGGWSDFDCEAYGCDS